MGNIPLLGKSTDKLITDTNPLTPRVVRTGSTSIAAAGFSAVTGGYSGYASILLSTGDKDTALIPIVDVTHYIQDGGGIYENREAPYTATVGTAITRNCYVNVVNQLVSGNTYEVYLNIYYFSSSISSSDRDGAYYTQTFYYTIYSTSAYSS